MPRGVHKQIREFVEWSREGITRVANGAKTMPKGHQNGPILIQNDEKTQPNGVLGVPPWRFRKQLTKKTTNPGKVYYFGGPSKSQGAPKTAQEI